MYYDHNIEHKCLKLILQDCWIFIEILRTFLKSTKTTNKKKFKHSRYVQKPGEKKTITVNEANVEKVMPHEVEKKIQFHFPASVSILGTNEIFYCCSFEEDWCFLAVVSLSSKKKSWVSRAFTSGSHQDVVLLQTAGLRNCVYICSYALNTCIYIHQKNIKHEKIYSHL